MHPNGLAITARVALHDGPVTGGLAAWKWSSANFSSSTFPEANHLPMQARANKLVRLQDPYFVLNGCQYVKSWPLGCVESAQSAALSHCILLYHQRVLRSGRRMGRREQS